jgi:ergothioneine biosynthesis protein EgtB
LRWLGFIKGISHSMMNWASDISAAYTRVRGQTVDICKPLEIEDFVVQPMEDASPPKWHLAHVTWFFETFILKPFVPGYVAYDDAFEILFNSYYNGVGEQFPRPERGRLSRPTVAEVMAYRRHVDDYMIRVMDAEMNAELLSRTILGLNHEQQHQELLFTDLKYNLGNNPLYPAYVAKPLPAGAKAGAVDFMEVPRGVHEVGIACPAATSGEFAFDNESPRHEVLVADYALATRLVTNGEYLAFMEDGGYRRPELWLSDAWSLVNKPGAGFRKPLYWVQREDGWHEYTLGGLHPLAMDAPVCHVSGYEADAYARWAGCRLPTEAEWEVVAQEQPVSGNFVESGQLHPVAAPAGDGMLQLFGDTWEWTSSSYGPYPGFRPFEGQLGEYNGKFMANQLVLRGGSCATPVSHIRPAYRNFFYPEDRWQFTGIRLAKD